MLRQAVGGNRVDERALSLLSQAERRTGDYQAAETTARDNLETLRLVFACYESARSQRIVQMNEFI